jgi:hypothetical protein
VADPKRVLRRHRSFVNAATALATKSRDKALLTADELRTDPRRFEREQEGLCLVCYYAPKPRISGQGFTAWACRFCGQEAPEKHHNTAVPLLCKACGDRHHLCVRCGAERSLGEPPTGS